MWFGNVLPLNYACVLQSPLVMPIWLQWIIGVGAATGALSVIWTKVIRPLARLANYSQQLLPLLTELTLQFKDNPAAFGILEEIAAQFKTDSGTTLRDVVNRLEKSAEEQREGARELRIKAQGLAEDVEAVKESARKDRAEAAHRLALLDEVLVKLKAAASTAATVADTAALAASTAAAAATTAAAVAAGAGTGTSTSASTTPTATPTTTTAPAALDPVPPCE